MRTIKLEHTIKASALKVAMVCRGLSKKELCNKVENLSLSDLNNFFKGYVHCIPENTLKKIMNVLNFPFEFLYQEFKDSKTSLNL